MRPRWRASRVGRKMVCCHAPALSHTMTAVAMSVSPRAAMRRARGGGMAGGRVARHDQLAWRAPRAASAPALAAPDEHRLDLDVGVPERRADHGRLDRWARPRHGPPPLRAAERHDALAGERGPWVGRRGYVGAVAPEQFCDGFRVAPAQVHRA